MRKWVIFSAVLCVVGAWFGYRLGWRGATTAPEIDEAFTIFQPPSLLDARPASSSAKPDLQRVLKETLPDAMRAIHDLEYDAFQAHLRELEKLSAGDIEALLEQLDPKDARYEPLFELLVRADPSRAFALAEKFADGTGERLLTIALTRWSAADPATAWEYVQGIEDSSLNATVLGQWAKKDLDGALRAWADQPEDFQSMSFTRIAEAHAGDVRSRDKLLNFLAAQPESNGRSWALTNTLQSWAKDASLKEIATWIDNQSGQFSPSYLADFERSAASVAVQRNPSEAVAWLMQRSTPDRRSEDLETLVNLWSFAEPNAAGEWLGSLPLGEDTDAAVATFARRIQRDDPQSALQWAGRIADEALRADVSKAVLRSWRETDPGSLPQIGEDPAPNHGE